MSKKPPSVEAGFRNEWSTLEDVQRYNVPRNEFLTIHPVSGGLTTDGVKWTTWTETTGSPTTKTTNWVVPLTSTLNWPGLDGFYLGELEVGYTLKGMSTASTSGTTVGYRIEYRNSTATYSTWQTMSTFKTFTAGTSTAVERTLSGYASLGTGYNQIPMLVRLRCYSGAQLEKAKFAVKNSSYFKFRPKKQS